MKKISKMTYDSFIIDGEVNEQLPLYTDNLDNVYSLNKSSYTTSSDFEIRANEIIHGNSSMIKSKNNITLSNGYMSFNGNSELVLDSELINSNNFSFEMKFKLTDITNSLMTLLMCKSNNVTQLSLIVDYLCRYIYANINGYMYTNADLGEGVYSLTDSGTINKDTWYTLKFVRHGNVATLHINDIFIRNILFNSDFTCNSLSIGQNIKGLVEYIKISKIKEEFTQQRYSIVNNSLLNSSTSCFYWTPDIVGSYTIANIGQISIVSKTNTLSISLGSTELISTPVIEDNTYYIALAYSKENQTMCIYVYNQTSCKLLAKVETAINTTNNLIDIINDTSVYNLAIYKSYLEEKHIIRNVSKKFTMSKTGNIDYNINEDDIGFRFGSHYHLPLLQDLNSLCDTITNNNAKVLITEHGVKSGLYNADYVMKLIDTDILELATENWNSNLHHKAYKLFYWSSGYSSNVSNPSTGYHAKWVKEYESPDSMILKFINCNSDFNLSNRMLQTYRTLAVNEIWNRCKIGDNIKIIFEAKSDIPCDIQVGIYKRLLSTGTNSFKENLKTISIQDSSWNEYCYETTIDSDWDLSNEARLYFYGHLTDKATSYIKNIYLIVNGEKAPLEVIKDETNRTLSIPFKEQIGLNTSNFAILYDSKLISNQDKVSNTIGNINWGIENNKLFLKISNKESSVNINEINIDEWMTMGLVTTSSKVVVYLGTKKGIYTCSISNLSLTANDLGNIVFDKNNCTLYKDLIITKSTISKEKFEKHHRTKMSYYNNSIYFKSYIEESNL